MLNTLEFQPAFELLENSSRNVFLTGKAGTGKSTFLQHFRKHTRKNMVVVAPTGVAALNVQGQTIHSLFRFQPRFVDINHIKADGRRIFKELELLIIDEISMVRADVFDGINYFLQLARKNDQPFGGVQVCVIGDLFQLPPVVAPEEKQFFSQYYNSPFFFAAKAYAAAEFQKIEFDTVYRQSDMDFIQILNAIRASKCDTNQLRILNSRVNRSIEPTAGTLILTTTNALADSINNKRLATLSGNTRLYEGKLKGNFGLNGPRLPAPEQLLLKLGAQVIFVKNDSDGRWVNGTIGIVTDLQNDSISVKVSDSIYEVECEKWTTIGYEFNEAKQKIVEKTLGSYTQFPLQLAWAITIHKSQGKTLDNVIIHLGTGAFVAGQLYVALSRCKTFTGITLKQPVTYADIRCDPEVVRFMVNNQESSTAAYTLNEALLEYSTD